MKVLKFNEQHTEEEEVTKKTLKDFIFLEKIDNGAGKSTIMDCLQDTFGFEDNTYYIRLIGKPCKVNFIDFHWGDKKFASSW
jgi:hypothetical protein